MNMESVSRASNKTGTETIISGFAIKENECDDALAIIKKYSTEGNMLEELDIETLLLVADAFDIVGKSSALEGNWNQARDYFSKSLEMRMRIFTETNLAENCIKLSESFINCGHAELDLKNTEDARKYYSDALYIAEKVFRETGDLYCLTLITNMHSCLGDIAQLQNNTEAAYYHYNSKDIIDSLRTERNV